MLQGLQQRAQSLRALVVPVLLLIAIGVMSYSMVELNNRMIQRGKF